eukprot:g1735.t1
MVLEKKSDLQEITFQNRNAVLRQFIEHRRSLETRAKKEWQKKNKRKGLFGQNKFTKKIAIVGSTNKLSTRKHRKISRREKRRRKRLEGRGWKKIEHRRFQSRIDSNGNADDDNNYVTTNNYNYYSPIKDSNIHDQRNQQLEKKNINNNINHSSPYKPYESFNGISPNSRGQLTRGKLVPAFIQYKPEAPPPSLKERPLTRRPLSKHSNRIPVGFRDKVGHFVDPRFNPNDVYLGENVEGLIDSIMGIRVGGTSEQNVKCF